jgi:glycosyltransferase involved in cell wall biosynthesis
VKLSLVITTYNWASALDRVLSSVKDQRLLPDEVLIADDGSTAETAAVIAGHAARFPVPLEHIWQEDKGFRAARARNRAIAHCGGDYIVLLDGDMILHPGFIADHASFARPGSFVQGGRVLLDERRSRQLIAGDRRRIGLFDPAIGNRLNTVRLPWLMRRWNGASNSTQGTRSCNMALWRSDVVAINGFNEAFVGWGREDSEFAQRLLNLGLARRRLRWGAIAYHLHHRERSRDALDANDRLLDETRQRRLVRCDKGLDGHPTGAQMVRAEDV